MKRSGLIRHDDWFEELAAASEVYADTRRFSNATQRLVGTADTMDGPALPKPGSVVDGRFELVSELGQGASGRVYKALHRGLRRTFAVKILALDLVDDEDAVHQIEEEARTLALVGHENIVSLADYGKCPRHGQYIVMEYLEGETLEVRLKEHGSHGLADVVEFVVSIASGLGAIHDRGVVHRDLNPANVIRARRDDGWVWKVLDLGLSAPTSGAEGVFAGTPRYMSPEQAMGRAAHPHADQFSLAAIAYEMLSGEPPWPTKSWLEAIHRTELTPLGGRVECVNPDIDAVLDRALRPTSEDRYPSIVAFAEAFRSASDVTLIPTIDPIDGAEAARSLQSGALNKFVASEAPKSVEIRVEDLWKSVPTVEVSFRNPGRLRREYRRNLIAGGMFIPSRDRVEVRKEIDLHIRYEPSGSEVVVRAAVVSQVDGNDEQPSGFGVALGSDALDAVKRFLRALRVGIEVAPSDVLVVTQRFETLTPGEAYLKAKVGGSMTAGKARALVAASPFDFEECLVGLLDKNCLVIESPTMDGITPEPLHRAELEVADTARVEFSIDDTRRVQDLVSYHTRRDNYRGAMEILNTAIENAPDEASFHHELSILKADFEMDLEAAQSAHEEALRLDPNNPEYQAASAYLGSLKTQENVRTVYSKEWPGARAEFVRIDPKAGRIWVAVRRASPAMHAICEVDFVNGTLCGMDHARNPSTSSVVGVAAPQDLASASVAALGDESTVSEDGVIAAMLDRSEVMADDHSPWFLHGRRPVAWSVHGLHLLYDEHPTSGDPGLYVVSEGHVPQRVDDNDGVVVSPTFAPDNFHVAWLSQNRTTRSLSLRVSSVFGVMESRIDFVGNASYAWSADAAEIFAFDHGRSKVIAVPRFADAPRVVAHIPRCGATGFVVDEKASTACVYGVDIQSPDGRFMAVWVDLKSGEIRGEARSDTPFGRAVLRSDGVLVGASATGGLLVLDLRDGRCRAVDADVDHESIERTQWLGDEPLVLLSAGDGRVEILALDVDAILS